MLDGIEDLESMRRRIRDEGRRRREEELRRRREKREASKQRRRRRSSSASSSASHDLLLSSPSPSPPPPDVVTTGLSGDAGNTLSTTKQSLDSQEQMECTEGMPDISNAVSSSHNLASTDKNNQSKASPPKTIASKFRYDDSDSDSDVDLADISRRLAERKKQREKSLQSKQSQKNASDKNHALKSSILWSDDDDSEDDMDFRQLIARRKAEKRKREASNDEAKPSKKVDSVNKACSQPMSRDEDFECAQQSSNNSKAATPATVSLVISCDLKSKKISLNEGQSSNNTETKQSASTKQLIHLQPASLVKDVSSPAPDRPDRLNCEVAVKKLQNSSTLIDKPNQSNVSTREGKEQMPNTTLHTTAKTTTVLGTAESTIDSAKSSSQKQSPKEIASSKPLNTDPIIGMESRPKSNVEWAELKKCLLVRTVGSCSPKDKVAGFDLDQTLVTWRCAGWPSRPDHYELWNSAAIDKCRQLHDDGYKLVVFSNQGGIKNALNGKKAGTVKGIIDWIAKMVGRPLYAVCSTKKDSGYHKGDPGMWEIMEEYCNCGKKVRPDLSFFVGDADGTGVDTASPQQREHQQSGTDKLFAVNVGKTREATMEFYTPDEYFGPSNMELRQNAMPVVEASPPLSQETIRARAALLGGYLSGPILLLLVGVQGSGKSTFCQSLLDNSDGRWSVFSQDTMRTRRAVEEAAKAAIRNRQNVVIDRMHLDPEQRRIFIELGKQWQVPVHGLVMMASKAEVEDRVKRRINHPGKVEGQRGAQIAVASLSRFVPPKYDEGFELLSYSREVEGKLVQAYRQVDSKLAAEMQTPKTIDLYNGGKLKLPMITLGTMNMKKHETVTVIAQAMQIGMGTVDTSIDTAPTYGNECEVGSALKSITNAIVTIKVPKRVTSPEQARKEVLQSLSILQRSKVDIILLHWPCDLFKADTLSSVWKELEAMKNEGLCHSIGVSNFSINALKQLISTCTIKPALNQVERHPLLPQYDLMEYCDSQDIVVQAHSPLGNGNKHLLGNGTIVQVSQESDMSPAQVILCWNLQHNIPVVTKCSTANHWSEAIALLQNKPKLSPQQMKAIDELSLSGATHRFVAPPFMYCPNTSYSWGDMPPRAF